METKTPYKSFRYKPAQLGTPPDEVRFLGRENRASMLAVRLSLKASLTSGHLKSYGSVNTCMMLTFLTLAQAKGLTPVRYESEAEGLLENIEGKYRITEVEGIFRYLMLAMAASTQLHSPVLHRAQNRV
jgi:hypothetical protein